MPLPQSIGLAARAAKLALASLAVAILLGGCGGGSGPGPIAPGVTASTGAVKVALLLPLTGSGNTPSVAKALKQAAELALFDFDNPSVSLVPKDTKGTPDGARAAAQSAIQDGAELIIGPLFAQRGLRRRPDSASVEYSDDCFFQRPEGRRRRRLSLELPRRARRAAHRFLRARRAANAISRCSSRNRPMAGWPRRRSPGASGGAAARRWCARASRRMTPTPCSGRCARWRTP